MVEGRAAYGTEQDCGGCAARLDCVGWQGIVCCGQCCAADVFAPELELMVECFGYRFQDPDCLVGDFGAYAVAGEDSQVQEHAGVSLMESGFVGAGF
jgi:hypothetical protein